MKNKNRNTSPSKVINADTSNHTIIGTFEGECADANITNANGLDITHDVWANVFNSEEYQKALKHGWYIGFLGHPEDPNCMDFEHGCIVMTSGRIDNNGKVYGTFNLIDTPVGRIVKAFIDAGVTFGISVRGAGDVVDNSVDPDTFVFRGFDLVTFPAFPESIPVFREIAASTDLTTQSKYRAVCASVTNNLPNISDIAVLSAIKSQFAKQSEEYKAIESRICELSKTDEDDTDILTDINAQKVEALTQLYLDAIAANTQLAAENEQLRREVATTKIECSRKVNSIRRITSAQLQDLNKRNEAITASQRTVKAANSRLKTELSQAKKANLEYIQKININASTIKDKDAIISSLNCKLDETVREVKAMKGKTSNLDETVKRQQSEINASTKLLSEYQNAYAQMYAAAIGVDLENINITANTSLSQLHSILGDTVISHSNDFSINNEIDSIGDVEDDTLITV